MLNHILRTFLNDSSPKYERTSRSRVRIFLNLFLASWTPKCTSSPLKKSLYARQAESLISPPPPTRNFTTTDTTFVPLRPLGKDIRAQHRCEDSHSIEVRNPGPEKRGRQGHSLNNFGISFCSFCSSNSSQQRGQRVSFYINEGAVGKWITLGLGVDLF